MSANDLPDGVRVRVDTRVNEKALRRVLAVIAGLRMIALPPGTKIFLACQPIDLRAGFDGLAAKAQQIIGADPTLPLPCPAAPEATASSGATNSHACYLERRT